MFERLNLVQSRVYLPAELDANVPFEGLERASFAQGEKQQRVQELAAAGAVEICLVGVLASVAGARRIEGDVAQVPGIVIIAGNEGLKPVGKAVDGRIKGRVAIIGKEDVEVPVQLGGGKVTKVVGNESQTREVAPGALSIVSCGRRITLDM